MCPRSRLLGLMLRPSAPVFCSFRDFVTRGGWHLRKGPCVPLLIHIDCTLILTFRHGLKKKTKSCKQHDPILRVLDVFDHWDSSGSFLLWDSLPPTILLLSCRAGLCVHEKMRGKQENDYNIPSLTASMVQHEMGMWQ